MVIELKHLDPKPTHPAANASYQPQNINHITSSTIPVQHQMSLLNCSLIPPQLTTAQIPGEETSNQQ